MTQRKIGKTAGSAPNAGQLIMSPAGVGLIIARQLEHPPLFGALSTTQSRNISRVRMVVVRDFDIRTMTLHSSADARSAKVAQLQANLRNEICLWLPELATQLRLLASWHVITREVAEHSKRDFVIRHKLWQRLGPELRHLFTGGQPGRPVAMYRRAPAVAPLPDDDPAAHFAVLVGRIVAIDALYLAEANHQRYRHRRIADRWETLKINP
jgi:hypothetical protein